MKPQRTLVIAEAGVNHNGSLDRAIAMVDAAASAGADMVKFQTFSAANLVTRDARKAQYQAVNTGEEGNQLDMLKPLELSPDDHRTLMARCEQKGIRFFSTAFDLASLDLLASLGQKTFKVPSGEITNLPYLRQVARLADDVLLSTGMANLADVEAAIEAMERSGMPRERMTVLHCTTEYPAPFCDVNLLAMCSMARAFGVQVGYSDHTPGIEVAIGAVALGATVIEKHFTLDRTLPGPDHAASLEPAELATMLRSIRNIEQALGDGIKRRTASEAGNVLVARKSIVAATAIRAGEIFSEANLTVKRPGTGISPMRWDDIIGKPAQRDYAPDELVES